MPEIPELEIDVPGGREADAVVGGLVVVGPGWLDEQLRERDGALPAPDSYLAVLDTSPEATALLWATLARAAPTALVYQPYGAALRGAARYLPWVRFLMALMGVGGALAATALLIAGLQVANERGAELRPLHVAGTPEATLRRSQWLVVAAPGLAGIAVATVVGLLAGFTWWWLQRASAELHAGTVLRVAAAALAVIAAAAWVTSRRLGKVLERGRR